MRIVVFGASGNAGTSLIRAASTDDSIDEIVGVARRLPLQPMPKARWVAADISKEDLGPLVQGADCVVHLAWLIQPSRDGGALRATNVDGSRRVFQAVVDEKVPALVYASSVGAYSPGPKDAPVDEAWPTHGVETSFYSRHKAATERMLDVLEAENPGTRIVRLRPGLIFKAALPPSNVACSRGRWCRVLVRPRLIPLVPDIDRLRFQCVHSHDIGEAYRLAVTSDVPGAFNVAADRSSAPELARLFDARPVKMRAETLRALWALAYKARLHPTPPGWIDLGFQTPVMDTAQARTELGWQPRYKRVMLFSELVDGMRKGAGMDAAARAGLVRDAPARAGRWGRQLQPVLGAGRRRKLAAPAPARRRQHDSARDVVEEATPISLVHRIRQGGSNCLPEQRRGALRAPLRPEAPSPQPHTTSSRRRRLQRRWRGPGRGYRSAWIHWDSHCRPSARGDAARLRPISASQACATRCWPP